MNTSHDNNKKSLSIQTIIGTTVVTGLVMATVGWLANGVLDSPANAAAAINAVDSKVGKVETRVSVLEKSDAQQDKEIDLIIRKLDTTNNNIVKLLVSNGIQPEK